MRFGSSLALLGVAQLAGAAAPSSTNPTSTYVEAPPLSHRQAALPPWKPPLSTRGRYIVDSTGARFKLRSGNWHGASGTYLGRGAYADPSNHHAGEVAYQTALCLDRKPIASIISDFVALGINSIRLPFSNDMIHDRNLVPDAALAANPQLRGKTPLEIYDAVVEALTDAGLAVILNNHTVRSRWCCGLDVNARWNGAQSDQQWQDDWVYMVRRYRGNARVVGAELYNEVRRDLLLDPTWGDGNAQQGWFAASLAAANRIQREASSDILVVVGGLNWVGIPTPYTSHGRPELQPVATLSHALPIPDKLVYSSHFYAYTGANNTGGNNGPSTTDPLYRDLSPEALASTVDRLAGYVATPNEGQQRHYSAPVWISEFGSAGRADSLTADRSWWGNFTSYMATRDVDWAYWPLVGWHEGGRGDGWALTMYDGAGLPISISDGGDWRFPAFQALISSPSREGLVPRPPLFRMLAPDHASAQQSTTLAAYERGSLAGKVKASCPDSLRLHGLSYQRSPRSLCTDAVLGPSLYDVSKGASSFEYVVDGRYASHDWAKGYTKYQCPSDSFVQGYSFTDDDVASAICVRTSRDPSGGSGRIGNRTVWFDRRSAGGDYGVFARDSANVGTCNDDELLVGFAARNGAPPAALLCQNFNASATLTGGAARSHPSLLILAAVTLLSALL